MDRSLFSKASSSMHGLLPDLNHELPRWRSPSPMAASIIPPPIVESTYASPPRTTMQSAIITRPTPLQNKQSELEADLQFLLDAQSEGLLRGLEGGLAGDQASTGSTTPTAQSVRSTPARRTARVARRKPGLRSSRKGIYNAILALAEVKDDELQGIDDDIREKEKTLEQINDWEKKKSGLQEATRTVESNEDFVRVQRLRQQADTLQEEINHVELQLADMKARHRKLVKQAMAVENSVQAKMASYTSSLRMLEEDVQKFLSVRPTGGDSRPSSKDGQSSVWALPTKRRTLQMAKENWDEAKDTLVQQREDVSYEREALIEGALVWRDVVTQVTEFERRLRTEMTKLPITTNNEAVPGSTQDDASQRLREVLDHMSTLATTLESKFDLAKDRNWNLLIAAIGAELEAIRKGREMLENVLGLSGAQPEILVVQTEDEKASPGSGDEIHQLDKSFQTGRKRLSNGSESEDDPDPELLFSKHDTDTE